MRTKIFETIRVMQSTTLALTLTCGSAAFAYDPLNCLDDIATVEPGIMVGLATELCSGAWTQEPVKCYQDVSKVDTGIPRFIAIDLCAGSASSEETIACYAKAGHERKLNRGLASTLCGTRKFER